MATGSGTGTPAASSSTWYATLAMVKARLGIPTTDTADDTKLEQMVEAISRAIDNETHRRFYTTASDEVRYYSPDDSYTLMPEDDIISVTAIAIDQDGDRTYETPLAATDWELWPYNAALNGKPYLEIRIATPNAAYVWPILPKSVKVTGKFGYSASAPAPICEVCLLASEKLFKRKDAIFGVVGSPELGVLKQMMRDDPELKLLLTGFARVV